MVGNLHIRFGIGVRIHKISEENRLLDDHVRGRNLDRTKDEHEETRKVAGGGEEIAGTGREKTGEGRGVKGHGSISMI